MKRNLLVAIAGCLLLAAIYACIFVLPNYLVSRDSGGVKKDARPLTQAEFLKSKNDVRATLLQGLGAVLVLAAASIGAVASFRQLQINRDGQITERFTKAVDQLGNRDSVDVRLGGIFSLCQIGLSSSMHRGPVVSLFASFIADHSPWPPSDTSDYPEDFPIGEIPPLRARARDLQAALDTLGTLNLSQANGRPTPMLVSTDLRRAWIEGDFYGAFFSGSNLCRSVFVTRTDLRRANFYDTNLEHSSGLESCRLDGAFASSATKWPAGFDPSSHGIEMISAASGFERFGRRVGRRTQD